MGRRVESVFNLHGEHENDLTYSLAWIFRYLAALGDWERTLDAVNAVGPRIAAFALAYAAVAGVASVFQPQVFLLRSVPDSAF